MAPVWCFIEDPSQAQHFRKRNEALERSFFWPSCSLPVFLSLSHSLRLPLYVFMHYMYEPNSMSLHIRLPLFVVCFSHLLIVIVIVTVTVHHHRH